MNRAEAGRAIAAPEPLGYDKLDEVFAAFGFVSDSPTWDTEVYYHPRWKQCGGFTARDDGHHVLSPLQRDRVMDMLRCVEFCERYASTS